MDPENNPVVPDTATDGSQVEGTEGDTNVDGTALTLEQLNERLGTKYNTVDAALDGLKETKNYVGKAGTVEKENKELKEKLTGNSGEFITKEQYEQDMFYSKHEDLAAYKDIINARAKELNIRPAEAVESDPSLKQTLEKLRGYDKTEGAKSVLMSNQRLGQVTDDMEKAQEAIKAGDNRAAESSAVKAVMSTFTK